MAEPAGTRAMRISLIIIRSGLSPSDLPVSPSRAVSRAASIRLETFTSERLQSSPVARSAEWMVDSGPTPLDSEITSGWYRHRVPTACAPPDLTQCFVVKWSGVLRRKRTSISTVAPAAVTGWGRPGASGGLA